ncbi:MAG: ATP-dependent zinc protease [Bacteroidia bacterium]
MTNSEHTMRVIGRREFVDLPELNIHNIEAKIDTGAFTSAIHCEEIKEIEDNGIRKLHFILPEMYYPGNKTSKLTFETYSKKTIKNCFGEAEVRYVIRTKIHIGYNTIIANFSLSDRKSMKYPILIGRKAIKGKFIVDVKQTHLNGIKLSLYLNQNSK